MRLVFGLVLIAGLGLAGFAVYMAQNYIGAYESALQEERAKQAQSVETTMVYVAANPLTYGQVITEEDVKLVPWPVPALPEVYFSEEEPILVEGEEPRVALRQIEPNEVFMGVKVSEPGGDAGLTSRLERGMRAFAIKVDVASGVSGFLRPGDRVDVYWTGRIGSRDPSLPQGEVTKLIQTGVELIAIDQTANVDGTNATIARTVTVAATPQQIASLAQAQSTGALTLSLMANNDTTVAEAIEVDQRSLLGLEKKEAPSIQKAREVCTIRTRRGSETVEMPIPCTN
ncbi:pilus assembly protein CpaB [Roseivivax lentus]|uniref:Pilus assembly protein CpaB n=1 Tax=Roseivivax lentus TaxID=633194 RepID=A0A1N7KXX6_9RHOB|nr:Flp pilus assembly protein CpaB [Roseivivax lentus]SIS66397.1 pilus assembly protein CpaB [Roseivivax lentus]